MTITLRRTALMAVLMMAVFASLTFAQESPRKLMSFTINVSHEVKMDQLVLPAGKYILYQAVAGDSNLFNLYQNDLTHSPIAAIRTSRIDYSSTGYPEESKIFLSREEANQGDHQILTGWAVAGADGWEIVSVVAKENNAQRRVASETK